MVCNAANLQFQSVKVEWGEGAQQEPAVKLDSDQETLQLSCDTEVTPGPATLTINFTGILNDKMRGFYRTKYTVDGEERYAAVTQFEATDARQAFPCWDEPAVKEAFINMDLDNLITFNQLSIRSHLIISVFIHNAIPTSFGGHRY